MGKTRFPFIQEGVQEYSARLKRYTNFMIRPVPDIRSAGSWPLQKVMEEEGKQILKVLTDKDFIILLDERGDEMDSIQFAEWLDRKHQESIKSLVFVIGGAYGFSKQVYQRANMQFSLSKLTFSHQVVPLFFTEQLYRAFTIIRGVPYHHG
jgi:23S rRNA (pseudouridine1915-N3)-methyltransferase